VKLIFIEIHEFSCNDPNMNKLIEKIKKQFIIPEEVERLEEIQKTEDNYIPRN